MQAPRRAGLLARRLGNVVAQVFHDPAFQTKRGGLDDTRRVRVLETDQTKVGVEQLAEPEDQLLEKISPRVTPPTLGNHSQGGLAVMEAGNVLLHHDYR